MRISDWSSDVCSSDLHPPRARWPKRGDNGAPSAGWYVHAPERIVATQRRDRAHALPKAFAPGVVPRLHPAMVRQQPVEQNPSRLDRRTDTLDAQPRHPTAAPPQPNERSVGEELG